MNRLILLMSAFMLLSACGDSHDQSQLQVVNQSPAAANTTVPTDATISATFNDTIDPSTVNTSSFMLTNQSDTVSGAFQTLGNNVVFTPSKPLSLLSKYTATVSQSIRGTLGQLLPQSCQWSFTTRDGLWDTLPAPPQGSESDTTKAAIDDNGRVLLAWSTTSGTYSSFLDNGQWTTPALLGQGGNLNTVISANDSYAVFWQVRNGNKIQLFCARYMGGVWLPAETFTTVDATSLYVIPTFFSDNSLFVIYWYYGGADGNYAYSRRFINNQGWQTSVALADQADWYVAGFHRSGKAVIAWVSPSGASEIAYAQSYDVNSGWSSPIAIGQYDYLTAHSVAVNSNGQGMVAFSSAIDMKVATTTPGTGWTQLTPVYQKQSAVFYTPPQIALDNLGNAMLVATEGSVSSRYFAIRYDVKNGWQQPVNISGNRIPDPMQSMNTLIVDDSGNFLLLWYGYDTFPGGIEHVYSSRYQNGVGWNTPNYLGRQDADGLFVKVAMNQRGEAVAVWPNFYPPGDANFTISLGMGLFH